MKKLIAGNWKMNGTAQGAASLIHDIENKITATSGILSQCDFVVCPPFLHLPIVKAGLQYCDLGGQDCSEKNNGAFTGDVSAEMLKDLGATYVILGHSERRQYHGDGDEIVNYKAVAAHRAGLITIICVGETEIQRERGQQNDVVAEQLHASIPECANSENTVIAYEPVWAIGTGKTATTEDIRDMHKFIRERLSEKVKGGADMRILYGGSVKPANAKEIFAVENVDGALIGGASLKAEDFLGIASAA